MQEQVVPSSSLNMLQFFFVLMYSLGLEYSVPTRWLVDNRDHEVVRGVSADRTMCCSNPLDPTHFQAGDEGSPAYNLNCSFGIAFDEFSAKTCARNGNSNAWIMYRCHAIWASSLDAPRSAFCNNCSVEAFPLLFPSNCAVTRRLFIFSVSLNEACYVLLMPGARAWTFRQKLGKREQQGENNASPVQARA